MAARYRLLTEFEVSEWTGISVATLQTWRSRPPSDRRPLPWTKVGRLVRYREDLILKWLEQNTYDQGA